MKTEFFINEHKTLTIMIDGETVSMHANVMNEVQAAEIVLREAIERPKRNERYQQYMDAVDAQAWEKTAFSLDGYGAFVGIHKPMHHWNGWAIPYFDKETATRVIKYLAIEDEGSYYKSWTYDEATDTFSLTTQDDDVDTYTGRDIDGKKMYAIGGQCLIWVAEQPKEFKYKDKSGRGGHYKMSLVDIVSDPNYIEEYDEAENDDDREETVIGWAMNAEDGDEYTEDSAFKLTRI